MRNKEKDTQQIEEKRLRILETGFHLFESRSIESVTMPEIAKASGVGRASLYRYFNNKTELVVAIGTHVWTEFYREYSLLFPEEILEKKNAAERFELYLDAFIELYRIHRDILRFNQLFNVFIQGQDHDAVPLASYLESVNVIAERFHKVYCMAQEDGSLRTDVSETEMFTTSIHLMMAAATRFAMGLVYRPEGSPDPEAELLQLKRMIMKEYGAHEVCPADAAKPAQQDCTHVRQ